VKFVMQARTASLQDDGEGAISAVILGDGQRLPADYVVQAVGIVPRTELADQAGLTVNQGVRVDDTLQTFDPAIYAIGECVEHRNRTFGLVAPLYEQAAVCASHLAELGHRRYLFADSATRLKISGIDLVSLGDFEGEGETLQLNLPDSYRRLQVVDNRIVGMVLYGDVTDAAWYENLWRERTDITSLREVLLMGEAFCNAAGKRGDSEEEIAA